ncbi:hypothetical protein L9F63_005182, partial [Diploptera punctata]
LNVENIIYLIVKLNLRCFLTHLMFLGFYADSSFVTEFMTLSMHHNCCLAPNYFSISPFLTFRRRDNHKTTAKLVLDEHFNQDPNFITSDFYTTYEDEPKTPSTPLPAPPPAKLCAANRVDSQDSNATSESDETYKAPLPVEPEISQSSQLTVVRQPLFPDSSKQAFEQAESSGRVTDASARNRRACFAHTNSQQQKEDSNVIRIEPQLQVAGEKYSRESLLDIALSPLSQREPKDWNHIMTLQIAKKTTELFDPVVYLQKCQESDGSNAVLSATEAESPDPE